MSVDIDTPTFLSARQIAAIDEAGCSDCDEQLCDVELAAWRAELSRDEVIPPVCDRCAGLGAGHVGHGCLDDPYERGAEVLP